MRIEYLLTSPVALGLLIITIGISIWGLIDENIRDKHTLLPYDMLVYKEYWRIITSGFFHGSPLHLMLNMVTFFFFGFLLEKWLGHWQFGLLYFLGLFISNAIVTFKFRDDSAYEGSVGASGAISAIILSAVICNPNLSFGLPIISEMYPILQLPGYIVAIAFIIYSLIYSFRPSELHINHDAHLWGAVSGIVLTFLIKPAVIDSLGRYISNF